MSSRAWEGSSWFPGTRPPKGDWVNACQGYVPPVSSGSSLLVRCAWGTASAYLVLPFSAFFVEIRVLGPATQLVPLGWASSSLSLLRCVFGHVLGVTLLSRRFFFVSFCIASLADVFALSPLASFGPVDRRFAGMSRIFLASGFVWTSVSEGFLPQFLHAEFSSNGWMEPACRFMSPPMFLFVRLPSRSWPFIRDPARMWWFLPRFPGRKLSSSLTVITTFLTQQGTPLRSSAIVWRLGFHGASSWSRHDAVRLCGVDREVRGKSGQRDVEEAVSRRSSIAAHHPTAEVHFGQETPLKGMMAPRASCSSCLASSCATSSIFTGWMPTPGWCGHSSGSC